MKQRKIFIRKTSAGYIVHFTIFNKTHQTAPYKNRISAIIAAESLVNTITAERYIFKIA